MNNLNYQKSFVNIVNYNGFWGPQGQCARTMSRTGGQPHPHQCQLQGDDDDQTSHLYSHDENLLRDEPYDDDDDDQNSKFDPSRHSFDTVTMNLSDREGGAASTFSLVIEAPRDDSVCLIDLDKQMSERRNIMEICKGLS